jgi:hypothetical protein
MRWHLAVMIPRLQLTTSECQRAAELPDSTSSGIKRQV